MFDTANSRISFLFNGFCFASAAAARLAAGLLCALALAAVAPVVAQASEAEPEPQAEVTAERADVRWGVGARIGGYVFREDEGEGMGWGGCRMDGAGLFTTLDLFGGHGFAELSFDFYAAHADVVADEGMDRVSLLTLMAAGFRMFPDFWVSPNVHVGGGAEWTDITLIERAQREAHWLPVVFIGLGAEFNLGEHLRLGSNLRILASGLPVAHGGSHTHEAAASTAPGDGDGVAVEMMPAGQLQFFVRYAL